MWFRIIQTKVLSKLQSVVNTKIKTMKDSNGKAFGAIAITTVNRSYENLTKEELDEIKKKRKFPSIYLRKMQGSSRGRTTEIGKVNAVASDFQIEVTTNTSQNDAEKIADILADAMTEIGYDMIGEPFPNNDSDTYKVFSRWRRIIADDDILNF